MRATAPGQSALLLLDVVDILSGAGTDYLLIGAMAGSAHGVIRTSLDADVATALSPLALRGLEDRCREAGLGTELRQGDDDDPIAAVLEISDAHGNRVDLLSGLRGMQPAAFSRAIEVPFQGESLRVASLEDYLGMKVFAGGPQDLEDARSALRLADEVDFDLLDRIIREYGPSAVGAMRRLRGS